MTTARSQDDSTAGRMNRRAALQLALLAGGGLISLAAVSPAFADDFVLGTSKPDPTNTGVPTGTTLTVLNGDLNMVAGRTYQNLDIRGFVNGAANASLVNSRVRGRGTGYVRAGLVNGTASTAGMRISRCTLRPDYPRYYLNGFFGENCIVERCEIVNVVDGAQATGGNVKVWGNYMHDFAFFDGSTGTDHAKDPQHPGWNHPDGVEALGGSGLEVIGNNLQMYFSLTAGTPATAVNGGYPRANYSNGITIAPRYAGIPDFKIARNWVEGGDVLIQVVASGTGHDSGNNGEVSGNRCGADQKPLPSGRYIQLRSASGVGTYTGLSTNSFDNLPSVPMALRNKPLVAQAGSGTGTPGMSYSILK